MPNSRLVEITTTTQNTFTFIFTMVRHSKLQKQVLSLYRQFLRAGRDKPGFLPRIRDEFRTNAAIQKSDVMHIEYLYRRAQRQLEQLKDVNTKQLGVFSQPQKNS
ncbi:succinate dehydrogenase assembly factor 1, mitochondrial [Trichomycterus rosablanca]|uniref:succinate dehydrogenase assembly factor 1, mitochondrial n=1 Tax=Trichomycterus rosablanca TaxID=2290929 RepID=UPI002F36015A